MSTLREEDSETEAQSSSGAPEGWGTRERSPQHPGKFLGRDSGCGWTQSEQVEKR